jgi:hypothetical protein
MPYSLPEIETFKEAHGVPEVQGFREEDRSRSLVRTPDLGGPPDLIQALPEDIMLQVGQATCSEVNQAVKELRSLTAVVT